MKVKILKAIKGKKFKVGTVVTVSRNYAKKLIDSGHAQQLGVNILKTKAKAEQNK